MSETKEQIEHRIRVLSIICKQLNIDILVYLHYHDEHESSVVFNSCPRCSFDDIKNYIEANGLKHTGESHEVLYGNEEVVN